MKPLDYGRSFLIGRAPTNEVRFWAESRTRLIDEQTGRREDYVQAASCKSEDTFAERDLFLADNYDFLPVFGPEYAVVFRRRAYLDEGYRECRPAAEWWNGQNYHLVEASSCTELVSSEAILTATYAFRPLVAQTEIWNNETGLRAIIEYPVKTMNTIRATHTYQVDTGPVAFPDLNARHPRSVDGLSLAFVAFNAPGFADFVIEVPTPIRDRGAEGREIGHIHHYSKLLSLESENRLYAVNP
jgi:hypothetical protein